jgi:hypothetical protein
MVFMGTGMEATMVCIVKIAVFIAISLAIILAIHYGTQKHLDRHNRR